jgi:tetratricopeptide (TPR) repeat protein
MQNTALTDQERDAISSAMHYALELQKKGILDQAERLYIGVLKLAPDHVEALNGLGVLKNQQGHVEEALQLMAAAVEINSSWAMLLVNYGFVLNSAGRYGGALEVIDRALLIDPANSNAEFHRGNALMGLGRTSEALGAFSSAIALNPSNLDAIVNRGNALLKLRRFDEAVEASGHAVAMEPGHAGILNNYGQALNAAGRNAEALEYFSRSLALDPVYYQAMINQAQTLLDLNRPDDALDVADQALRLQPHHIVALSVRGRALAALGRYETAIATFDAIIAVEPDTAEAYNLRGYAQSALNRYPAARASFQIATEIEPTLGAALAGEAITHLITGDLTEGFRKFQARPQPDRSFLAPLWLGEQPLEGKTLLIYAEQRLGDTLQFVRYAALAAARGATVIVEAQPQLKSLLGSVAGISRVMATGEKLPAHDLRCPMMSLPLAFGTKLATIPHDVPYLTPPDDRIAAWQARLPRSGKVRVGLVWAGSRQNPDDRRRSIALDRLSPLLATPGIDWVALQTDMDSQDRAMLTAHPQVLDLGDGLQDFADTAAVMSGLDLVIAVDTAAVHLAGALAKPVWVMLPFAPDWRWMLDRADSPWYPTAKLFRQPALGDWVSVIAQVTEQVTTLQPTA